MDVFVFRRVLAELGGWTVCCWVLKIQCNKFSDDEYVGQRVRWWGAARVQWCKGMETTTLRLLRPLAQSLCSYGSAVLYDISQIQFVCGGLRVCDEYKVWYRYRRMLCIHAFQRPLTQSLKSSERWIRISFMTFRNIAIACIKYIHSHMNIFIWNAYGSCITTVLVLQYGSTCTGIVPGSTTNDWTAPVRDQYSTLYLVLCTEYYYQVQYQAQHGKNSISCWRLERPRTHKMDLSYMQWVYAYRPMNCRCAVPKSEIAISGWMGSTERYTQLAGGSGTSTFCTIFLPCSRFFPLPFHFVPRFVT